MQLVKHWPSRGHGLERLHLHGFAGIVAGGGDRILALCEAMMDPVFGIQQYDTFTLPLLNSSE